MTPHDQFFMEGRVTATPRGCFACNSEEREGPCFGRGRCWATLDVNALEDALEWWEREGSRIVDVEAAPDVKARRDVRR